MAPAKNKCPKTLKSPTAPSSETTFEAVEASLPSALRPVDTRDVENVENSSEKEITHPETPSSVPNTPLNQENFENIFYNPQTHVSAAAMLSDHLQSLSKSSSRHRVRSGEEMNLRSSDPKPEKQGQSKTDNPIPGKTKKVSSKPGTSDKGVAMVQELLNRYETNKKKAKHGSQEVKEKRNVDPLDDDSFEFDEAELDLWDDEEDDELKSDFLKFTVPQYDIKKKLCDMHYLTIKRMTPSEVEKTCIALIPELREILNETAYSKRHDIFKKSGISKQALREITVGAPFNTTQDTRVVNVINDVLFADKEPEEFSGELLHYVGHVLVPEALIRIYATANKISFELAEKELRYGAGYDGQVDEELVKTLDVKSENAV